MEMQDPGGPFGLNTYPLSFDEQEQLNCPRCESANTKFCYYNNYNLSQPRYFCKSCRRYWTKGGTLRNIPVGGASRKPTKRSGAKRPGAKPEPEPGTSSSGADGKGDQPNCNSNSNNNDWTDLAIYTPDFRFQ